ncbi:MAG TPA: hypothetical protein VFG76_13650, partial [Candidatus Polarisedimenticolia bacterium]|nr:hypothetical protein [Candidatus Polarisedimenticolia bacterium]
MPSQQRRRIKTRHARPAGAAAPAMADLVTRLAGERALSGEIVHRDFVPGQPAVFSEPAEPLSIEVERALKSQGI